MITMDDKLSVWLTRELKKRGWSHRELSRRAKVSQTAVSEAISEGRNVGCDFCLKIAKALGEPPERIFRMAGLLPALPMEDDPTLRSLIEFARGLPAAERLEMLRYVEYRYKVHTDNNEGNSGPQSASGLP